MKASFMATRRIYYLEEPLSEVEATFVASELCGGEPIEQVRIPYVLPILPQDGWTDEEEQKIVKLLRTHLKACGMRQDQGKQVILVAPKSMDWYSALARAVAAETGLHPYLVQTNEQREAIGNPGDIRILDMAGLAREN
jgi:hypothetical protein